MSTIKIVCQENPVEIGKVLISILSTLSAEKPGQSVSLETIADLVDLQSKRYTLSELQELRPNRYSPAENRVKQAENGGWNSSIRVFTDEIIQALSYNSRGGKGLQASTGCPVVVSEKYQKRIACKYGIVIQGETIKEREVSRRSLPVFCRFYRPGASRCVGGWIKVGTEK